jgi:hypothetical protein
MQNAKLCKTRGIRCQKEAKKRHSKKKGKANLSCGGGGYRDDEVLLEGREVADIQKRKGKNRKKKEKKRIPLFSSRWQRSTTDGTLALDLKPSL